MMNFYASVADLVARGDARIVPICIASLAALAPLIAMLSEAWGFVPCALCLWQRWPYWIAAALAFLAAPQPGPFRRALLALSMLAVLVTGGVGILHAGVEFAWWSSPLPECLAAHVASQDRAASLDALFDSLPRAPHKACDDPTFPIPGVPISMAMMNVLYAFGLATLVLVVIVRARVYEMRGA